MFCFNYLFSSLQKCSTLTQTTAANSGVYATMTKKAAIVVEVFYFFLILQCLNLIAAELGISYKDFGLLSLNVLLFISSQYLCIFSQNRFFISVETHITEDPGLFCKAFLSIQK